MAADDRFYLMEYPDGRPLQHGDLGSNIQLTGIILEGEGVAMLLMMPHSSIHDILPHSSEEEEYTLDERQLIFPSLEEWSEIIRETDDPQILVLDQGIHTKVWHRKARYIISGSVQQKIWARDGFLCMYCLSKMGEVQLSIDHFIPLELGGKNDSSNYLSACRKCNKDKGSKHPQEFLNATHFSELVKYLAQVGKV